MDAWTRAHDYSGIREYGPGKFSTRVDECAWMLTMDASFAEEYVSDEMGYNAILVWMPESFSELRQYGECFSAWRNLRADEQRFLLDHKAAVVEENDAGFVQVYFTTSSSDAESYMDSIKENINYYDEPY